MNRRRIVVFSGGSAANNLVDVFGAITEDKSSSLSYVIPISDNGGSTSELIRVFGGPGIGDVRSRLVRLIPEHPNNPSSTALKTLFNHRLPAHPTAARIEWLDIVEARHPLWTHILSPQRELIRSFLNTINLEIVKRLRPSSSFNFQSASVGNLFLTGARLFTGSFESAIYMLGSICGIPGNVNVIPAINSNFSHHISAGLVDGTVITGQNAISHPSQPSATPSVLNGTETVETPTSYDRRISKELSDHDRVEDATLPGSLPTLRKPYLETSKSGTEMLPSPIARIWYINPYGQEIRPAPNMAVLDALEKATCVIYSIGSLYTSIIPCLILRGVGEKIASSKIKHKILILNGSLDRETSSESGGGFGAKEFVRAIVQAGGSSREGGRSGEWRDYVTHVVHLIGEGTPRVEREELAGVGIECVRIYGRREGEGMVYDGGALRGALEAIVGGRGERTRRNTVDDLGVVVRGMVDSKGN